MYRRAAASGFPAAMLNLAVRNRVGTGVLQDYVRSHMWASLAAAAGGHENALTLRVACEERMVPAQIAEAQRLARECLASNYKRCGVPAELPPTATPR